MHRGIKGRELLADGTERFFQIEGHPEPGGEFTNEGTIGDFLEAQGVAPFVKAADEFFYWLCAAVDRLDADIPVDPQESPVRRCQARG